jgi:hypothetical protein
MLVNTKDRLVKQGGLFLVYVCYIIMNFCPFKMPEWNF